jgi:hypothetical protein
MRQWRARDPVTRFQRWLVEQGWWDEGRDTEARQAARRWVLLPPLLLLGMLGLFCCLLNPVAGWCPQGLISSWLPQSTLQGVSFLFFLLLKRAVAG